MAPQAEPSAAVGAQDKAINSAIEHLRAAAEQMDAAGLASEAAQVREQSSRLKARLNRPAELTRQRPAPQIKAPQAHPIGRPHQIVLRCKFVELPAAAAEEFEAAAVLAVRSDAGKGPSPRLAVYKNAEPVVLKLAKAGKARIVGSPELCTNADMPASVLNGGEFPILVPQANNNTVTIQWREFGTRCTAVPHWLDTGKIQLDVSPELTEIDRKHSVVTHGLSVPGLTTRRANVRVEMNLGETAVVNFGAATEEVELADAHADDGLVSLLPPVLQAAMRLANAEIPQAKPPITLFLVTPLAGDPTAK
jgi:hypothetical protein